MFEGAKHHKPVQDIAYATPRFYAKNGTFVNYYMYDGGTIFWRSRGPLSQQTMIMMHQLMKPKILPTIHPESVRVRLIAKDIIQALKRGIWHE